MPPFLPDPARPMFGILQGAIAEMLARGDAIFLPAAHVLFTSIAAILVVARGTRILYGRDDPLWGMLTVLFPIATMFTIITYYQSPIPGIGISFSNLVTDQAIAWTQQLEGHATERMYAHFDYLWGTFRLPALYDGPAILLYVVLEIVVTVAKGLTVGVVAGALIFHAITALLGPIFLPFALVPHLSAYFWRWLTVFIATAMTSVVAAAYVLVGERLITGMTTAWPTEITTPLFVPAALYMITVLLIHLLCLTAIPIYAGQLFGAHVQGPNLTSAIMLWRAVRRGK